MESLSVRRPEPDGRPWAGSRRCRVIITTSSSACTAALELGPQITAARLHDLVEIAEVHSRPLQDALPVWLAIGGNPGSAVRAGTLGLPLALAIIGGRHERFVAVVELYRQRAAAAGNPAVVSINSHAYVAPTPQQAADEFYPAYAATMSHIGRERVWPMTRAAFDEMRGPRGSLLVGSPREVAEKLLFERELLANERFPAQMSVGPIAHARTLRAIEPFATEVVPAVRAPAHVDSAP